MTTPAFSLFYIIMLIYMYVNASLLILKKSVILFYSHLQVTCCCHVQDSKDWCEQILRPMILEYFPEETS